MSETSLAISGWERSMNAAERVKDRMRRAAAALAGANIRYAVVGGNAVAEFVGRIDEGAVRNTRDVDILIDRADLPVAKQAMESAGFVHGIVMDVEMFMDGRDAKPSESVHLLFAGERIRPEHVSPCPDASDSEAGAGFQVIKLERLVEMKLDSNRRKDQVHIEDMIAVGLIDASWPARFSPLLAARLQHILDTPGG